MADAGRPVVAVAVGMAVEWDHHDYAKRRCDQLQLETQQRQQRKQPPPPPPAKAVDRVVKRGRQLRDPEGGTYISARSRARRAPLPMKLRALPASFWEQPNLNTGPSPGAMFSALPPLCKEDCFESASPSSPRGPGCPGSAPACSNKTSGPASAPTPSSGGTVSPADTDLLFSLFRSVEARATVQRRARGRPRRSNPTTGPGAAVGAAAGVGAAHRHDDPCLMDSLTGSLLPARGARQQDGSPLSLAGLDANRNAVLRGGSVDGNNLAQILSDLVVKL